MASSTSSGLGIGLSLVFGCLFLALAAELYYMLWCKKRINNTEIEHGYNNYSNKLIHLFCWKTPSSMNTNSNSQQNLTDPEAINGHEPDLELGCKKDLLLKTFGGEEGVEAELMRLHNLAGPPRFLFTIKEETKEDLESEDGKSRKWSRTRSLSDLIVAVDSPFLTPLASPRLKPSPLNPLDSFHYNGFNPLFESSAKTELNRLRSSPPPTFKFLRDAEEKLYKRLLEETEKIRAAKKSGSESDQDSGEKSPPNSAVVTEERDGSIFTFIVGKKNERELHEHHLPQCPSSSSQVLPLASSPTTFRPIDKKSTVH